MTQHCVYAQEVREMIPSFLDDVGVEERLDDLHRKCIAQCKPGGLFLEFGVCEGTSLMMLRSIIPVEQKIYGFDSFKGLPEEWAGNSPGTFKTNTRIELSNVELVEGWFEETVPTFADLHSEHVSYMHVDCDLYSSTRTVLEGLDANIVPGTVILFDEFFGYSDWKDHEYRAFVEFIESTERSYEIIARHTHFRVGVKII